MRRIIVTVGGTGQVILHYYNLLFLTRKVTDPFTAYVIDTDRPIRSLEFISKFYEDARILSAGDPFTEPPLLKVLQIKAVKANSIHEALTGEPLPDTSGYLHPANAFFDRASLAQKVDEGLYARPALSAVAVAEECMRQLPKEAVESGTTIIVVGSVIGGTGGGLLIHVLTRLQELAAKTTNAKIRAVLLGDYFRPDPNKITSGQDRFISNRTLFLKTLGESVPHLDRFCFVEEARMPARETDKEKKGEQLSLPDADTPYWKATVSLDYLLVDTTEDVKANFFEREVSWQSCHDHISRDSVEAAIRSAVGRVEALSTYRIIERVGREAVPSAVWGRRLTEYARGVRRVMIGSARSHSNVIGMFQSMQAELDRLWLDKSNSYYMRQFFPPYESTRAVINDIRNISWPAVSDGIDRSRFDNPQAAQLRAASALLYAALRFGGKR